MVGRKTKVLYFSESYSPHDYRFLEALAKNGLDVYYMRFNYAITEQRPIPKGVKYVTWDGDDTEKHVDALRIVSLVSEVFDRINPDIIHAGPLHTAGFLATLADPLCPVVTMSWAYDVQNLAKKDELIKWKIRFALEHSEAVIVDCEETKRQINAIKHPYRSDFINLPWGIGLNDYPFQDLQTKPPHVLLYTRSWERDYGVMDVLEGFKLACEKVSDLYLILMGTGSLDYEVRSFVKRNYLEKVVRMPGIVSEDKLPLYYKHSTMWISANKYDGTSVSMLQAAASGLQLIMTELPVVDEWEEKGLIISRVTTPEDIAKTIEYWCQPHAVNFRKNNRAVIELHADWHKNFRRVLDGYREAIRGER